MTFTTTLRSRFRSQGGSSAGRQTQRMKPLAAAPAAPTAQFDDASWQWTPLEKSEAAYGAGDDFLGKLGFGDKFKPGAYGMESESGYTPGFDAQIDPSLAGYQVGSYNYDGKQQAYAVKDASGKIVKQFLMPRAHQSLTGSDYLQAAAVVGAPFAIGSALGAAGLGGAAGGAEALSGMDLAADAAPGAGNNIGTAAQSFGGGSSALSSLSKLGINPKAIAALLAAGVSASTISTALGGDSGGSVAPGAPTQLQSRDLPTLTQLGTTAPDASTAPGIAQSADSAAAIRDKQLTQAGVNLDTQNAAIDKVQGLADDAVTGMNATADRSSGIADTALGDYLTGFRPVQQQLIDSATNMDSQGEQDKAAGRASSDAQRQIDAALAAQRRSMASMGVNPGTAGQPQRADIIRMAAQRAGAANVARRNLVTDANALRTQVAELGQRTLGTSLAAGQASDASRTGAVSVGQVPFNMRRGGYSDYLAGTTAAGNSNTSAANINLAGLGVNLDAYKTNQTATQLNNSNALQSWQLQTSSDLDRAKLAETGRQFDTDAALRDRSISAGINNQNAAGLGSLVRFGVDNWDKLGKIGTSIFGG